MTQSTDDTNKKKAQKSGIKAESINTQMQQSYLDYSYSVIVGRAIPDVRDGLKPVQRRILYSMHVNRFNHTQFTYMAEQLSTTSQVFSHCQHHCPSGTISQPSPLCLRLSPRSSRAWSRVTTSQDIFPFQRPA